MRIARSLAIVGLLASCGTAGPTSPTSPDSDALQSSDAARFEVTVNVSGEDGTSGTDSEGADVAEADVSQPDTGGGEDASLHPNPGFEAGASWVLEPATANSHSWSRTGDPIHESDATFVAFEGRAAMKMWGAYNGTYPNTQTQFHQFEGAAVGDTVTVTGHLFTHPDDVLAGGSVASVVAIAVDASGAQLAIASADLDAAVTGVWQPLSTTLVIPEGTAIVRAGVSFTQPTAETQGSVYADGFSTSSTGQLRARPTRELVWHDEFDGANGDGTGLDRQKWFPQIWPARFVNNELQSYDDRAENVIVSDGLLRLRAIRGDVSNAEYSSGRIETDGLASWRYGRFEARVQVPQTRGTWPAFWMLPEAWAYGGWPASGEIDVMEYVGCDPELVHATVHTGAYNHIMGTQRGDSATRSNANSQFHTFAADWTEDRIVFMVDGEEIYRFDNDRAGNPDTWPFDQRFYLILNLAVGGDWGGYCGVDGGGWPQDLLVDWVRVYQTDAEIADTNALPAGRR